jgi:hypothetical protein
MLQLVPFWSSQTNTFVVSRGEATVTLEDVAALAGPPILGFAVREPLSHKLEMADERALAAVRSILLMDQRESTGAGWAEHFRRQHQQQPKEAGRRGEQDTSFWFMRRRQIAVFSLPLGAVMPLHDHPGMTVFAKLLISSAHLQAYDWVRPRVFSGGFSSRSHRRMLAQKVRDHDVTAAASGTWVLFPNHGGNIHRTTAAEDAHCAFLDVLTAPYAAMEDQRRCAYYQDFEVPDVHHHPGL